MKSWHWMIGVVLLAAVFWGIVWVLQYRPVHPAATVPAFTGPRATIQFAKIGEYEQEDYHIWVLCTNHSDDLLYVVEGRGGLSAAPAVAAIPSGCARLAGTPAPAPGK